MAERHAGMKHITLTKSTLAIVIAAFALVIPATAWAATSFTDVEEGRFYTEAVEWAVDNEITFGTTETTFSPDDGVTRAQNVTFAKRYDDNVVQPALTQINADIAQANTNLAADSAAVFANGDDTDIEIGTGISVQSVTMTAPADGTVIANSAVYVASSAATITACSLRDDPNHDGLAQQVAVLSTDQVTAVNLANTQGFNVTAGESITIHLFCTQLGSGAEARYPSITAIFTAS